MRALAGLLLLLGLGACQTASAPTPAPYRLIDYSDDYVAFFDRTQNLDPAQRVAAFKTEIAPLFLDFYSPRYGATQAQWEARVARSFERFQAMREKYLEVGHNFAALLGPANVSFRRAFPDAQPIGDIFLMHTLGEMDGGTREFHGRIYFVFGADVMAQLHHWDSEQPFFHHELSHIYHRQFFPGCEEIWCNLWTEGLATYVAAELNPGSSDDQLLLNLPEPIRASVDAHLTEAVCEVSARLDSHEADDKTALFSFNRLNADLPPRFGYYVGYLVAREQGKTHSLRELEHMRAEQVRPMLEASLGRLAVCPPAVPAR